MDTSKDERSRRIGDLYRSNARTVYRIALHALRDQDRAQDLMQDVFVKALEKCDTSLPDAKIVGWLKTVTQRLAIDELRKMRFRKTAHKDDGVGARHARVFGATVECDPAVMVELLSDLPAPARVAA